MGPGRVGYRTGMDRFKYVGRRLWPAGEERVAAEGTPVIADGHERLSLRLYKARMKLAQLPRNCHHRLEWCALTETGLDWTGRD